MNFEYIRYVPAVSGVSDGSIGTYGPIIIMAVTQQIGPHWEGGGGTDG